MTVRMWIGAGVAVVLVLSLLIGVAVAKILGLIGEEIADVLETESWTSAPLTRQTEALAAAAEIGAGAPIHDRRSDSSRT